jgi:acyl-CoA synthetase (AMP-forming)/AMP-acid ligase II
MSLAETPAAMFTTSGTGGLPKGALISHHAIVMHHLSILYQVPYDASRLMSLPMFHLFGALFTHIFPIRYGQPLYILPKFDVEQYVRTIYIYRITETYMVPAMVQALNRCSDLALSEFLTSLRYVGVAGAAIDADSVRHFQEKLHQHAQISQLWGMTEMGIAFQIRYGERDDTGSIGRLLPNYEIKLLDTEGRIVTADNHPGELYIRGPGALIRYRGMFDCKEADGWFRTGDIMSVRGGKFYIVGRAKELIKVRG